MYDGSKVVVERKQILGSRFDQELSQFSSFRPVKGNIIRVPLSEDHWSNEWEAMGLSPLALGRKGGLYYLAAKPKLCDDYDQWGRPVPAYVFFRYSGEEWQRISVEQFPSEITSTNLSQPGSGASEAAIAKGYIKAEEVLAVNSGLADYASNIYRSGLKGFADCRMRLEVLDRNRARERAMEQGK